MQEVNWGNFKAKFNGREQKFFEWLCYLLFCKEFNQPHGIFRFVNQSGMETNPIKIGKDYIAWEAKFYEDKLTNHKDEFIKKIKIAKNKNPEITKMFFYTPIDWTESSKKTKRVTNKQNEIVKFGKEKNIKIIFRGASFFESTFVSIENELIAKHFYSLHENILDLIKNQQIHSENILSKIQPHIIFNGKNIEIDRSRELEKLKEYSERILILSGEGGIGKTAIVKNLYLQLKGKQPFYIFEATEFELSNVNNLCPNLNFQDFLEAHKDEDNKIIVIDSAEKLLDLKNTDPFKEFLAITLKTNWKLIFTARDNYLKDLNDQFWEIYKLVPSNINLQKLNLKELNEISDKHHFSTPKDENLLDFIKNPFYLNEYLKFYKEKEETSYIDFKEKLWDKNIKKSKPAREQCFLKIAFERANDGEFFVNPSCEAYILDNELRNDGILGYESPHGYFITHDLYEEWALEKIIEKEFIKKPENDDFFKKIGNSLAIRRAFRNWISEKLLLDSKEIKKFVEEVIENKEIEQLWKDETLVSILLSDYSEKFFEIFKDKLLTNNQELLKKLTFLLRITCKEIDSDLLKQLGVRNANLFSIKYVLTKPKGKGWEYLIKFIYDNLVKIGIGNIYFILPVIYDWNYKFKEGETTKFSSLIALQYYQWIIKKDVYFSRDNDVKATLFKTILYGASEIKDELGKIIEAILKNKWKNYRDPYSDLSQVILTKLEGVNITKVLPQHILSLANLFWSFTPKKAEFHQYSSPDIEQEFGIEDDHFEYFPASSYQTPIYWLLQYALKETVDFILGFTNKTVESFAKSDFAKHEIEEVEVFTDTNKAIKQYISDRLWCTYRGTQVAPLILESTHMALEKFFLETGEKMESKTLENWLLYMLKNSKSASISGIVTSVVLAYPEKTFNIAKILFRTKGFFLYDTHRLILDEGQKSSLLMLKKISGVNFKNEIHDNERLETCDKKHRKWALENLFLNYQFFRSDETSEKEAKERRKILWRILDNYYKELAVKSKKTELDKTWELYLARMDGRKMNPVTKTTKEGLIIYWNPQIEPELKKHSDESIEKTTKPLKYTTLKLWASYKMKNDEKYKQYEQYEKNPKLALKEAEEIIERMKVAKKPELLNFQYSEDENFYLFNNAIPADVCSVLTKDYFDKLSKNEKIFCKNIILEFAQLSLTQKHKYQISDGTESAISVLPILLQEFPEEKKIIIQILLLTLFNEDPINMAGNHFNIFPIMAIHKLWFNNFDNAQSLLFGYLLLKPRYEKLRDELREENYKRNIYKLHENEIIDKFLTKNKAYLKKIIENKISIGDLKNIEKLDLYVLNTAFQLIPLKTTKKNHEKLAQLIILTFSKALSAIKRDERVDPMVKHAFLKKLADFVLNSSEQDISNYLKPFIDDFTGSEAMADLFQEFILAEDRLNTYNNFWQVWGLFYKKVVKLCEDTKNHWYLDRIVKSYLFAQTQWKETTVDWHTIKDGNKSFFGEIVKSIGHYPSVLFSISKLLNDIGSIFLEDGVSWISSMLCKNKNLWTDELEPDTIYYIEIIAKKHIYKNREKIRKTKKSKQEILTILDFLIKKGSVVGYMLRESAI